MNTHLLARTLSQESGLRTLKISAYLSLGLLVVTAIAYVFDSRLINGINVWNKPNKFNVSFLIQLITVIWLWRLIEPAKREGKFGIAVVTALAMSGLIEIFYIAFQSMRGRASHYNNETAWEAFMYFAIMGGAAVVLVVTSSIIGLMIWRYATESARRQKGLYWGAAAGLFLGGVATLITASVLASGTVAGPGHWEGGIRTDVGGLPIVGWSRTGDDLRVPHFFATHLMQALPLAGLLADRLVPKLAGWVVAAASAIGLFVVNATFKQAVSGQAFWPLYDRLSLFN
jgi:hypothetical protein